MPGTLIASTSDAAAHYAKNPDNDGLVLKLDTDGIRILDAAHTTILAQGT